MDIKKKLRESLLKEGAHASNNYGCLMVYLDVNQSEWDDLQNIIDSEDLYEPAGETGYGKELEPHVTILYGLHNDISDEEIEEEIEKIQEPSLKLDKVSAFKNKDFDVLKFDVESSDLHKLNKIFTENFPYTTDYPNYHPHCTTAYVKSGTADKYIKELNDFGGISVSPSKIVYSKANGQKKKYKF